MAATNPLSTAPPSPHRAPLPAVEVRRHVSRAGLVATVSPLRRHGLSPCSPPPPSPEGIQLWPSPSKRQEEEVLPFHGGQRRRRHFSGQVSGHHVSSWRKRPAPVHGKNLTGR